MNILVVVPAYNEEKVIGKNVLKIYEFLKKFFLQDSWKVVVADNNSSDLTKEIVLGLSKKYKEIEYFFVPKKGKGLAIRLAWEKYDADVYCFMDADLSTDLEALPRLISSVGQKGYDMACGSRFHKDSIVKRSFIRKIVSIGYLMFLRLVLHVKINDAPCGFKAINNIVKKDVLPQVKNNGWFFDSELLIFTEKLGYRIIDIAVKWEEKEEHGRESKVHIVSLSLEYIRKVIELRKFFLTLRKGSNYVSKRSHKE